MKVVYRRVVGRGTDRWHLDCGHEVPLYVHYHQAELRPLAGRPPPRGQPARIICPRCCERNSRAARAERRRRRSRPPR